jgi:hypothetical protein
LKRFWFGCSRNLAHPPLAKRTRGPLKVLAVPRNFFVVLLSSFQRPRTLAPSLRPSYRLYPCCLLLAALPLPASCLYSALPTTDCLPRRSTTRRLTLLRVQGARFLPRLPTPRQALSCRPASLLFFAACRAGAKVSTPRRRLAAGVGVLSKLDRGCQPSCCGEGRTSRHTR